MTTNHHQISFPEGEYNNTNDENERTPKWFLLCLSVVECLLCTGVTFGLSALTISLKRDGQFAETCFRGAEEGATIIMPEGEGGGGGAETEV